MTTPPAHDEFCPPGLKYDDPARCWICIGLAKARADERTRLAETLQGLVDRVLP